MSNVSVACPGQTVAFSCTLPGSVIRWSVDPPPGSGLSRADSAILIATELDQIFTFGSTGFMFQYVLTVASEGNLTTTLTTITEISLLRGSMVTCIGLTQEGPLTIQVAGKLECFAARVCRTSELFHGYCATIISNRSRSIESG